MRRQTQKGKDDGKRQLDKKETGWNIRTQACGLGDGAVGKVLADKECEVEF